MRRILVGSVFMFLVAGLAAGQSPNPVVEARVVMATDAAHAGATAKAAVVAQVAPGYHINDHKPFLDYLIPSELKLEPSKQVSVVDVVYPKGQLKKFAFSDMSLSVYEGTLVVGAVLQVAKAAPPGEYTLKGKFAYQACNDHACLPPASVPLTLTVKVVGRRVPLKRQNADVFDKLDFD